MNMSDPEKSANTTANNCLNASDHCDVLVIGSGAGGLSTAIVARKRGLNVLVIEKEAVFGGTTAYSGGVVWIPGNHHFKPGQASDSPEQIRTYLRNELGNYYDDAAVETFLNHGPEMLDFFERETEVKFTPSLYPDYHPNVDGAVEIGRSLTATAYDASNLGPELKRLRPPLKTITFIGMMFNSSNADLKHFFNATRSVTSALYVMRRLISHVKDLIRHGRGVQVTSGNALAARLAKSAFDLGIPILTRTPAAELLKDNGRVIGARVVQGGKSRDIHARIGVVLAAGGFPHDAARIRAAYPHVARGSEHFSPTPEANTGDGIALATAAGGQFDIRFPAAAAWMPVSKVPLGNGRYGAFPHLVDRYKPGVIAVLSSGKRFTNEANSYHDVGAALIAACAGEAETAAWLICDHKTIRKYGLGFAKPAPVPVSIYVRNGYLQSAPNLAALAAKISMNADQLQATVQQYNKFAANGTDPEFGRGTTAFNRFLGDPDNRPNPNVKPIGAGPYYALKVVMGDLGTFDGLTTSPRGEVLSADGKPILGLFAVGNDRASIMGGNYPGAGITLGPIMTFGYVTGQFLAEIAEQSGQQHVPHD